MSNPIHLLNPIGGGSAEYTAGDGISIQNDVISVKVDGETVTVNGEGELQAAGGVAYTAGDGISIQNDEVSVKVDGSTVTVNADGELQASDTTYTAGNGIDIQNDEISVKMDGSTITLNGSGELSAIIPEELPGYTSSDDGRVLGVVDVEGSAHVEWVEQQGGLPASTSSDEGKVLAVDSNGDAGWEEPKSLVAGSNITITESSGVVTISSTGSGEIPLPALPNTRCLRFEFEDPTFDPSVSLTSANYTWAQVTADPSRNIWDASITATTSFRMLFEYALGSAVPCSIIDGVIDTNDLESPAVFDGDMSYMFNQCSGLKKVKFTLSVLGSTYYDMRSMFKDCYDLKSVDIHVTAMFRFWSSKMFVNCSNLKYVNVTRPSWVDIIKVLPYGYSGEGIEGMFSQCNNLETIDGIMVDGGSYIGSPVACKDAFEACYKLTNLFDGTMFGHAKCLYLSDPQGAFRECKSIKSFPTIYIVGSSINCTNTFAGCESVKSFNIIMEGVDSASSMFARCYSLCDINLNKPTSLTQAQNMFRGCVSLSSCPKIWDSASLTNVGGTYYGMLNVSDDSASTAYTALSAMGISDHSDTFTDCGSQTSTGTATLANIPSSWGGTGT